LPARAAATALLVLSVTGLAASLGPALSGALAPFPIALSVVCAFTAAQAGQAGVLALLRGIVPGLDGFALFCFLVAVMINEVGGVVAFGVATAAAVIFAIFLIALTSNRSSPSAPTFDQRSDQVMRGAARGAGRSR
jgi:hypothetical protein